MNSRTRDSIIKLNANFYKEISKSFNKNRESRNWLGVDKLLTNELYLSKHFKVIDIACGNCRVVDLLQERYTDKFSYTGLDNNSDLLCRCRLKLQGYSFKYSLEKLDVINDLSGKSLSADLVLALGITHHVPGSEHRDKWFNQLGDCVNNGGRLLVSFWYTKKADKYYEVPEYDIYKNDLESGDCFISWGNLSNVYRYYHQYTKNEINKILHNYQECGLFVERELRVVEFKNNINKYYLLKKEV